MEWEAYGNGGPTRSQVRGEILMSCWVILTRFALVRLLHFFGGLTVNDLTKNLPRKPPGVMFGLLKFQCLYDPNGFFLLRKKATKNQNDTVNASDIRL